MFENKRIVGIIETEGITSKGNYGSRNVHSITDLTLKKWLLHDYSIQNMEPTIHTFTDLESCYYTQL